MLKSNLIVAWRSLLRNRTSSLVNITGLALGLAVGILILLYTGYETSFDRFHADYRNIHQLLRNRVQGGEIMTSESVPGPLAAAVKEQLTEVKYASRVTFSSEQIVTAGNKSTYERGIYADPDFFRMMTFPALSGDPAASLNGPATAVITERTAIRLFGTADATGKVFTHNSQRAYKVGAVIRDIPSNSSFQFDMVLPMIVFEQDNKDWIREWNNNRIETWVAFQPGADKTGVQSRLKHFAPALEAGSTAEFFAFPMKDKRLYAEFRNGKPVGGLIYALIMLGVIGVFVMLIACVNFMNLATAQSEKRAKEVGVRKTMGASRGRIAAQFLSEAMLMAFIALLLGALIAKLALPGFNRFMQKNVTFSFDNWKILAVMLALGLFTGLVAGSYPALFLSRFQPVKVLKGIGSDKKGGSWLRKGLVTFQFLVAIFLIIGTVVTVLQIGHMQQRPMGYDAENLLMISAKGELAEHFDIVRQDLLNVPGVVSVSGGTDNLLHFSSNTTGIQWPGKTAEQDFGVTVTSVQYDWVKTAGLSLVAGRDFSASFGGDSLSCMLNESAVRKMGLKEPLIGTRLGEHTLVGVVKDFVYNNPSGLPGPMIIFHSKGSMANIFIRMKDGGEWKQGLARIETAVKKSHPAYPFEVRFVKEDYQRKFEGFRMMGRLAMVFGGMAIFIACMGLFALSMFVVERRTREIGIRKVMGASETRIWAMLSVDFMKPVLAAFVLAVPLAAWAMKLGLQQMEYRITLSWWIFALAGALCFIVALGTVSWQGLKAAFSNPVRSLKSE
ncbi:FtsX-like permease family protein [Chitinophaga sp. GCM10012297]|uniref:ABC transporter permease n=1 Tax=Chitinophaga chungangae TaxID=2821488 RepID=A0ABS3YD94_9BACT|nr:FtsX-like permease family protein [Chitinophaga chungangae]MBO9152079.1 ABC transporter permease [Chitinophaga chungangae]